MGGPTSGYTVIHLITAYRRRLPTNRLHPFGILGGKRLIFLQNPPADDLLADFFIF